jgi:hypothetical protein
MVTLLTAAPAGDAGGRAVSHAAESRASTVSSAWFIKRFFAAFSEANRGRNLVFSSYDFYIRRVFRRQSKRPDLAAL